MFQDLPVDMQPNVKHAEFADVKKKLRGAGIRYGLLFPRLIVTVDKEKYIYATPDEAKKYGRVLGPLRKKNRILRKKSEF